MIEPLGRGHVLTDWCGYSPAAAAIAGVMPAESAEITTSTTQPTHSQVHSQASTPDGTPPMSPTVSPSHGKHEHFPDMEQLKAALPRADNPSTPVSSSVSFSRPRPPAATRQASKGGGVQMVLNESGSWSMLADQTATLPAEAGSSREAKDSGSVLGFLRGKKGRDRSPKPKEAGVLGKMGARQIIS